MARFYLKYISVFLFISLTYSGLSQTVEYLKEPINTVNERSIAPYISYDGNNMVFIRQSKYTRQMLESKKQADGTWSEPIPVAAVNVYDSLGWFIDAPTYNHDASIIYFSMIEDNRHASFDIYFTKKEKGVWQVPVKMKAPINSSDDDTDPFITYDGKFFYFARRADKKEEGNYECYQIYVSEKNDTVWGEPKLLPRPINLVCDRAPRVATDGKTLYFMSVRGEYRTGIDLYQAKKVTKNAWFTPTPVDTLNNVQDEEYPSIPLGGDMLYYNVRGKKKNTKLEKIVKAKLPPALQPTKTTHFYGYVTNLKSQKPVKATIDVIDPNTSELLLRVHSDEKTGKYDLFLQKGKKYRIDVYKEKSSHFFFYYDARKITKYEAIRKDIKLYNSVNLIVNIYDSEIFEPISSQLLITDKETGTKKNIPTTEIGKGKYKLTLQIGKKYNIAVKQKHFEGNDFDLDLAGVVQFSEFERDVELQVNKVDYEINLSNQETGEGVEATVEITNLSTNEKIIKKVKTGKDGKLKLKLRNGTQYEISVKPKGYAFYNTTVNLVDENADLTLNAELKPLKKDTKIELSDINFETNSADLSESSYEELNRLVELLNTNPLMKVEISAHTDDVGSKIYNLKLSDRRAASVKEFLFDKGISSENIVSKGYGESKPAYLPFDTEENRAKNRRVELKIINIEM